ncbi:phage major tail tube protein [Azonexus sp. R2A61]|uniref:phage major tail tube protein n=1 Tax=Azonexus sp. R2A61 TaxID=2744443 RepID=UPI001F1E3B5E|nr:phage major tail tube protein [Azonexus sp. R2A61]
MLPTNLKNFNLYNDGESLFGVAEEVVLPKLSRQMEEYQAAGMPGPIDIDMGNEKMVLEWTSAGLVFSAIKQYGAKKPDALMLRFSGAYQREDTGDTHAVEIVVRGRHKEIDMGTAKVKDPTKTKITTTLAYYKLIVDGEVLIEYDALAMIFVVNGTDLLEDQRKAIGLA